LDLRGRKWLEAGEDYIVRSCITCAFTNISRVIISGSMRWVWHVGRVGDINAYKILVGRPRGKGNQISRCR